MRLLLDEANSDLAAVIEQLLGEDVDITAREIARRHPTLRNASAFTRNPKRHALIAQAQQRQMDARNVSTVPEAKRTTSLVATLGKKTERVNELEGQVAALVASHAACIRAVMHHGGMAALERFWADYKVIGEAIRALEAMPPLASVSALSISCPPVDE